MNKYSTVIFKLLASTERTHFEKNRKYRFFFIYYFIIETYIKKYFDNLIFENLLTADNIVEFFRTNEFGIRNKTFNKYIYKKDIIDETSFYGELSNVEIEKLIKKDFEDALLDEIKNSDITIDIENYINVFTEVSDDNIKNVRIYSIYIRYYRNQIIEDNKKLMRKMILKYIIIFGLLSGFVLTYYLLTK